ncbi:hypothetical protein EYZ11_005222 [Aspergillus tanneri]|uniref:Uncharacterized protein n=1 Tax=Aspergillus tanneri TaxID=1220188 RepID=A0A4S3JIX4_9EURO|nr:hypothetical protein EYZ11_005222 [Aspergillus tanneri]
MPKYDIQTLLTMSPNGRIALDRFTDQAVDIRGDGGFARFLKAHTSPKHQRVTAGGRIVPMEPHSGSPKCNLPVSQEAKGHDGRPSAAPQNEQTALENVPTESGDMASATRRAHASVASSSSFPNIERLQLSNTTLDNPFQGPGCPPVLPSIATTPGLFLQTNIPVEFKNQHQFPRTENPSQGTYQPVFADCNFYSPATLGAGTSTWFPNVYPALNGSAPSIAATSQSNTPASTATSFLPGNNAATVAPSAFNPYSSGVDPCYPNLAPQWCQATAGQALTFTQQHQQQQPILVGPTSQEIPCYKSFEEARKRHELLSGQLSRLDRYTALHSWEIDPQSKKLFVEQRKSLVRELDVLRLYREQLDMIFGGSNASTSSVAPSLPALPNPNPPGNMTRNRLSRGLDVSTSSSNCAGHTSTTKSLAKTTSSVPSVGGSFRKEFLKQNRENVNAFIRGTGPRNVQTSSGSVAEPEPVFRERRRDTALALNQRAIQMPTRATPSEGSMYSNSNGSASAMKDISAQLEQLYHRIEETSSRREPIDGLLKELSIITAGLLRDKNEETERPFRRSVGADAPRFIQNTTAGRSTNNSHNHAQGNTHALKQVRRLWESEPLDSLVKKCSEASFETDDENGSGLSSSYVSTTDSWTTVHKGE